MLIVLGVSLDRDGIKFSLGDNDDLSVEVDAAIFGFNVSQLGTESSYKRLSYFI